MNSQNFSRSFARAAAQHLIFLFGSVFAAEQDPRMVPPANGVRDKLPRVAPTPAGESAKSFRVLDGFRMQLLVAEPLVASPVAMAYDENGRAYVCEMRDYPYTDKARHQRNQENPTDEAIGTVRLLEDTNGDGVFEKSTVFADGLSWPTGVACWKGGVFVTATPDIWYLKDTDGNGEADLRRKVFTGFRKLNVQSVMNNLVWGLDNKIHGAGGGNGGQILPGAAPGAKPLVMARNDFRFDPVTEQFELLSGGARFGVTFDDWGHRFLCDIRNPAQHVVLPQHYLARNPFLPARSALHDMAEAGDQLPVNRISQPELWRVIRAKRWAGERDIVMPRSELIGAGVVTSSSGITVYRGAAYPEKYRGNVFICEVAGNLFYRLQLTPEGPTFKAARVDTNAEMVASTDNWFRPVNFVNAPDGTLHVVDMYRENIEHPWSIPDDIHAAVDLESGRERGRIWRLAPPTFRLPKPPRLGRATTLELVATLENPNVWWRETAQRLLVERQDLAALPELHKMVKQGRTAQARLHALCTVAGLKSVTDEDLLAALVDEAAGVRENAVKLAESSAGSVAVRDALLNLASDLDPFVRFQLAFTLGQINDPRSAAALSTIAGRDAVDPWFRTAVLSSAANNSEQLLTQLLSNFASNNSPTEIIRELAEIVGVRGQTAEMQRVLSSAVEKDNANSILPGVVTGIGEGLKRSGKSIRAVQWNVETSKAIERIFSESALGAIDPQKPLDARVGAIRLLTFDDFGRVTATLVNLLDSKHPQEVQLAAVRAISGFPQPEIAPLLLARWRKAVPAIRSEIVLAMLSGRNRVLPLLQAIENDLIPANQVPFARRASLLRNSDADVKALATKILGDASPRQRKEVIARYEAALSMKGDASRGKAVFESSCASCHRAGEIGNDVGPNLATIRQWNPEQILNNILDPNREVAPNFVSYMVETTDARTLEGLIANETAASLTLKRADAVTETILRRDINQLSGSGLSLMPEALETAITIDQMADLITFLLSPE